MCIANATYLNLKKCNARKGKTSCNLERGEKVYWLLTHFGKRDENFFLLYSYSDELGEAGGAGCSLHHLTEPGGSRILR